MSSVSNYARALTKVSIGQILQTVGFQSAQSTALDILVEILERYVMLISRSAHDYSELANRTEPTMDDLASAFERHHISLAELDEFVNWVDTPEYRLDKHRQAAPALVARPLKTSRAYLGICSGGGDDLLSPSAQKELADRENDEDWEHIYDYMPLMTRPQATVTTLATANLDELNRQTSIAAASAAVNESLPNINELSLISNTLTEMNTNIPTEAMATTAHLNGHKEDVVIEKNGINRAGSTTLATLVINRRMSQIGTLDDFGKTTTTTNREANSATPKLPPNFHRPRSKYKKNIYNNAVSIYNKSISGVSGAQPLEEIIDEEKLLKQQQQAAAAAAAAEAAAAAAAAQSQQSIEIESQSQVAVPDGDVEMTQPSTNVETIGKEDANEEQVESPPNEIRIETAPTPAEQLIEKPLQQKLKVDEMLEAYLHKYTSATSTTATTPAATTLKIKLVSGTTTKENESVKKQETPPPSASNKQPTIPKLKITNLYAASSATTAEFNIEEFSTATTDQENRTSKSRLESNDHFDDNAVDSDELMKSTKAADEQLIWKPVTNKLTHKERVKSPVLVGSSTTTNIAVPTSSPPSATAIDDNVSSSHQATKPIDSQQQQQPEPSSTLTTSSSSKHKKKKKNKEKEKSKEKPKEKEKESGGEKAASKKEKDKDKKHHHHHHHHKKKDKEKHKGDATTVNVAGSSSPSKKKDKKLKKLLKKEQKKMKAAAAVTSTNVTASVTDENASQSTTTGGPNADESTIVEDNTTLNEVSSEAQVSFKISKTNIDDPMAVDVVPGEDLHTEKGENVESTSTKVQSETPPPPPLPKLKLKITSSSSNDPSTKMSSSSSSMINNKPSTVVDEQLKTTIKVKPLKINIGKMPPSASSDAQQRLHAISGGGGGGDDASMMMEVDGEQQLRLPQAFSKVGGGGGGKDEHSLSSTSAIMSNNDDNDEIELGEVVKPKQQQQQPTEQFEQVPQQTRITEKHVQHKSKLFV